MAIRLLRFIIPIFFLSLCRLPLIYGTAVSTQLELTPKPKKFPFRWENIHDVHAFGDSYTFVQGSLGFPNFSFIGDAFHLSYTPQQLLSDEIVPRNTSSDGSNWIEFLTGCFSGNPAKCAAHARRLYDFAFAGADVSGALLPLHHNFTVPLVDQVEQWTKHAADVLLVDDSAESALVAWWIGINDVGDTLKNTSITNITEFWRQEMSAYFQAVETVYEKGLRNFLFINVPPENRSPSHMSDPQFAPLLKHNINLFNDVLQTFVFDFSEKHGDANALTFDANTWFNEVLDNPHEFGFENVTGFCTCPTEEASSFFWFNSGHPTEHVHRLLASAIEKELERASE